LPADRPAYQPGGARAALEGDAVTGPGGGGGTCGAHLAEERELVVRVELVVVDGPDAVAWRARQAAAVRALLEWMATQTTGEASASGAGTVAGPAQRRAA